MGWPAAIDIRPVTARRTHERPMLLADEHALARSRFIMIRVGCGDRQKLSAKASAMDCFNGPSMGPRASYWAWGSLFRRRR
jgi:hypothetical protein